MFSVLSGNWTLPQLPQLPSTGSAQPLFVGLIGCFILGFALVSIAKASTKAFAWFIVLLVAIYILGVSAPTLSSIPDLSNFLTWLIGVFTPIIQAVQSEGSWGLLAAAIGGILALRRSSSTP